MVSDAAKKRRQNKKKEKKNLYSKNGIGSSKSQTNLTQFLVKDNNNEENESKEIGDQELEDLLAENNAELKTLNPLKEEFNLVTEETQNQLSPISSHSKSASLNKYTFFKDEEDSIREGYGDDDLFGADEDLDFLDNESLFSENEDNVEVHSKGADDELYSVVDEIQVEKIDTSSKDHSATGLKAQQIEKEQETGVFDIEAVSEANHIGEEQDPSADYLEIDLKADLEVNHVDEKQDPCADDLKAASQILQVDKEQVQHLPNDYDLDPVSEAHHIEEKQEPLVDHTELNVKSASEINKLIEEQHSSANTTETALEAQQIKNEQASMVDLLDVYHVKGNQQPSIDVSKVYHVEEDQKLSDDVSEAQQIDDDLDQNYIELKDVPHIHELEKSKTFYEIKKSDDDDVANNLEACNDHLIELTEEQQLVAEFECEQSPSVNFDFKTDQLSEENISETELQDKGFLQEESTEFYSQDQENLNILLAGDRNEVFAEHPVKLNTSVAEAETSNIKNVENFDTFPFNEEDAEVGISKQLFSSQQDFCNTSLLSSNLSIEKQEPVEFKKFIADGNKVLQTKNTDVSLNSELINNNTDAEFFNNLSAKSDSVNDFTTESHAKEITDEEIFFNNLSQEQKMLPSELKENEKEFNRITEIEQNEKEFNTITEREQKQESNNIIIDTKLYHLDDESFFNDVSNIQDLQASYESSNEKSENNDNDESRLLQNEDGDLNVVPSTKNFESSIKDSNTFADLVVADKLVDEVTSDIDQTKDDESFLGSDDESLLASDIDEDIFDVKNDLEDTELKAEINDTVVQNVLKCDSISSETESHAVFDFLKDEDDSILLDIDEESLLDSDEDLLDDVESDYKDDEQLHVAEKSANKYAPTIVKTPASQSNINSVYLNISNPIVPPTQIVSPVRPTIISPQIVKINAPDVLRNEIDPALKNYKNMKQKTDAYDFPVDLVSTLKPPAKAKPIKTSIVHEVSTSIPMNGSLTVAGEQNDSSNLHSFSNPPAVPVNLYASTQPSHPPTKNPYAPSAALDTKVKSSITDITSNVGIVKPPLNILSQSVPAKQPETVLPLAAATNKPFASTALLNKGSVPSSNTDLPFNIAPPKAVPRMKKHNIAQQITPPISVTSRARAVSNVSATSLSNNGKPFSPVNTVFDHQANSGINGNALSHVFEGQAKKSRTSSINENVSWGKPANSLPNSNPYAPSFQHSRKNSSISHSPINTNLGQIQPATILSPSLGLNNILGNQLNVVNSIPPAQKISHARSQSSVYAPSKSHGAGAKYAPIVHPSVQQAFSQQQHQSYQFNQNQENQMINNGNALEQSSIAGNYMQPTQQKQGSNLYTPHGTSYQMHSQLPLQNSFTPVNSEKMMLQNGSSTNGNISSNIPQTGVDPSIQQQFDTSGSQAQPQTQLNNSEDLLSRQYPIMKWTASGEILSLKPSLYSNVSQLKISSTKSHLEISKFFTTFPGPIHRNKTKAKPVLAWMLDAIDTITCDSAYDSNGKILWQLLMKKIELNDAKVPGTGLHNFAENLYDPTELLTFINNSSFKKTNNSLLSSQHQMTGFRLDFDGLAHVLTYLRVGDHSKALDIALKNDDFSMAMVIASLIGKEKWTEVVDLYLKKEFQGSGPDSEFAVNLLSSIFQVYIGNGKSLVEDFANDSLKTKWAVENWNIILAAILSNGKTSTDTASTNNLLLGFLVDFGVFLYKKGEILAAHSCFILADIPLSDTEIESGSNLYFREVGSPNSLDGMLLSELYEFSFTSMSPKFTGFISLIPSKLSKAQILLLQNEYALASKYLDSCSQLCKELSKGSSLQLKFAYIIEKLKADAADHDKSWIGKPTLSGVWGTLDKSFNKLIGGDDISALNEPIKKSESKLFDNYETTLSRNNSQSDLHNGASFINHQIISGRQPPIQYNKQHITSSFTKEQPQTINKLISNDLTKSAGGHLKNDVGVSVSGPPSISSVSSSEQFNQQVASNLAKLHPHSRNQSTDSILSFAPNQQRYIKKPSSISYTTQKDFDEHSSNTHQATTKTPVDRKTFETNNLFESDYNKENTTKIKQMNSSSYMPVSTGVHSSLVQKSYSPKNPIYSSSQKYAPFLSGEQEASVTGSSDSNLFNNISNSKSAITVNSPPKNATALDEEQQKYDQSSALSSNGNFLFPAEDKKNSQTTLNAFGESKIFAAEEKHHSNDLSPNFSFEKLNKTSPSSEVPLAQSYDFKSEPVTASQVSNCSLASPLRANFVSDTKIEGSGIQNDLRPPSKQFLNGLNNKSPSYIPVTPQQHQSSGWTRSHSRSSSQILAEISGFNGSSKTQAGNNNANSALGSSAYTSRNVSVESNFASSEPIIRQARSSSVVFTPDSKRKPTEKIYYDDIVEEEEEDVSKSKEAAAIESKLAKARAEAEKQKLIEEKQKELAKKDDIEKSKKKDNDINKDATPGWFGWLKTNPNEKKPIKAKLGTKNQFYYDDKLKRWVNKNATEDEKKQLEEEASTPPPPPPVIKKKSVQPETKPRSGSVMGGPTERTMGVLPPRNPLTGESLIPEVVPDRASFNKFENEPVIQSLPEEDLLEEEKTEIFSQIPTHTSSRFTSNVNLTSSNTGLDDLLSLGTPPPTVHGTFAGPPGGVMGTPPTGRVGSTASRRNKRSNRGYVNVMDHL
ncbi:hypothetical protein QEN19_001997 [Hanseniaspora menglaensis]